MHVTDITVFDKGTDRDFDVMVYGSEGRAVIALPDWDFTCTSWENGGMVDSLAGLIDEGKICVYSSDSLDASGWYGRAASDEYRRDNIIANLTYFERSLLPHIKKHASSDELPLLVGTGLGALNATILMLRHPDWYSGLLALSGVFDARLLVDAFDDEWAQLSPVDIAAALPQRGKVLRVLREKPCAFVCGQDDSETGIESQRALDTIFAEKQAGATFEYWGFDVSREERWWHEELRQLVPCVCEPFGLAERKLGRRVTVAQDDADHAAEVLAQREHELNILRERLTEATAQLASAEERLTNENDSVSARAKEAELRANDAREAWAERERVAQMLAEAQAAGDAAQAKADEAAGALSVAEWIRGEAQAARDAASGEQAALVEQLEEAETKVREATSEAQRASEVLAEVNATIELERKEAARKQQKRVTAKKRVTTAKRASTKKTGSSKATTTAKAPTNTPAKKQAE